MKFSALRSLIINPLSFIILFLFSIFYLLPSAALANAASQANPSTSSGQANYPASNTNPDVQNNLHNWTQSVMIEVMSSLTCQIAGVDPINPKQSCLGADQKTGKIGFLPSPQTGGAIGFMGNMIATLYTPPLHTGDYFQNLAQNFGITKHAFAQQTGTGLQSLTPLINIWAAFRNIVYLLLVIVFVVIGLAIMLRVKIDPRTVMTIQNQIPKIIVGILAVTFSFAIAGFLIDIMWVFIYLIYGIISGIPGVHLENLSNLNPLHFQGETALGAANHISSGGFFGTAVRAAVEIGNIIADALGGTAGRAAGGTVGTIAGTVVGLISFLLNPLVGTILTITGGVAGAAFGNILFGTIGGFIAFIIIIIALLVALFRLWFTLIIAYVQILLAVVLAPFWIIGGIVPGSPISLGGWFRNMGANLLAFPATLGLFMLARVIIDTFGDGQSQGQFVPPFIGASGTTSALGPLIGLGIILMTPNVVNLLKAAVKAPKTDTGIRAALGAGTGTASAPFKSVMTGVSFVAGQKVAGRILPTFLGGQGKEAVSGAASAHGQASAPHVQST